MELQGQFKFEEWGRGQIRNRPQGDAKKSTEKSGRWVVNVDGVDMTELHEHVIRVPVQAAKTGDECHTVEQLHPAPADKRALQQPLLLNRRLLGVVANTKLLYPGESLRWRRGCQLVPHFSGELTSDTGVLDFYVCENDLALAGIPRRYARVGDFFVLAELKQNRGKVRAHDPFRLSADSCRVRLDYRYTWPAMRFLPG